MISRLFVNAPPKLAAGCLAVCLAMLTSSGAMAQQKAKPINTGEVLSGELTAMRSGPKKKRVITYQLTSEPRRLPPPSGMCNLETGPETFQIVTNSDAEAAALKPFIGKSIALKANEMACAQAAGQLSDAVVTKWSVVTKH
ncbi:hypothetical protein [Afipia broomeae]|uniref:Uncharacterized protein n=1 Tax=Afipia broomeae ATCC 49717 TaxID=883078 RepID=K8P3T0_9BRAD|nr:hypothetical protein [Afipia broomeae]EKS37202.1 hypothetical protein HMPREF9695_03620 [Afipia broomeae ATCC 49717]